MTYHDVMQILSQCGLGAILVARDDTILSINEAGRELLGGEESLIGRHLREAAPFLCADADPNEYENPMFNVYLRACPPLNITELPVDTQLLVFRDATKEFRHDLLSGVLDHVSEAITIWDHQCRMLAINDAGTKLESHLASEAVGKTGVALYNPKDEGELVVPRVLANKRPVLNLWQDFVTHTGKNLQTVSNTYPIFAQEQFLGAACMMEDWTKLDEANKRIIELQNTLLGQKKGRKKSEKSALSARWNFTDIVYSGRAMREVIDRCTRFAQSEASVLIYGETGTGKELFAQSIHNGSPRANGPFLALNCAAIPDTLLESMLFGSEKGAYTGAESRAGLFEQADGGTLLLDEINSMNITLQAKLLRVLQEGTFRRVGGSKTIQVDVRVISNINMPPEQAIEEGALRADLFYRLGVINVTVPPLRERLEDIPLLCKNFILSCNKKLLKSVSQISPAVLDIFNAYNWPGNVRELQHAIEYAMHLVPGERHIILPGDIPQHILKAVGPVAHTASQKPEEQTLESVMQTAGREFLTKALQENDGNISRTARALGITRQKLQHRLKTLEVNITGNI